MRISDWSSDVCSSDLSQGLGGQLTGFYNAAQDLAADPTSGSARDAFLASAGKVANQFRSLAQSFAGTRTGIRQDVDQTVARINEIGRSLSSLNSSLRRTADGTSQNAGLEDDRDRLLQELAGLVKIDAEIRPAGTVNVRPDNSNGPLL